MASKISIAVGVAYFLVGMFYTAMAVLSGQSRPGIVAVAFVVGAWVVAVPLTFPLRHVTRPRLLGLWLAMMAGYFVTTLIAIVAVARSDWDALSLAAIARSEGQEPLLSVTERGVTHRHGKKSRRSSKTRVKGMAPHRSSGSPS